MCRKITSHWQPLFSKKMAAAASFYYKIGGSGSFSYKIGGGGKDLATLLAAVLTWSGYWRKELIALLSALLSRDLTFQVLRVPTALNIVADALSRAEPLNTEWTLPQLAFGAILRWAGPLEVDLNHLMASPTPINHRIPL